MENCGVKTRRLRYGEMWRLDLKQKRRITRRVHGTRLQREIAASEFEAEAVCYP